MDLNELKKIEKYEQLFQEVKVIYPKLSDEKIETKILNMINFFEPLFKKVTKKFVLIWENLSEEEKLNLLKIYSKRGKQ